MGFAASGGQPILLVGEPHLVEHRGAEQPVRVAQRFRQVEMAVIVADDQLDRLPGFAQGAAKSRAWRWNSGVSQVP